MTTCRLIAAKKWNDSGVTMEQGDKHRFEIVELSGLDLIDRTTP
jgi:hypothetical protein